MFSATVAENRKLSSATNAICERSELTSTLRRSAPSTSTAPRLYDPSRGAVLVDGADLRSVDVSSLRSQIAFVADDSFLFSATVAENIAYAHSDATLEEIEVAARRAQA